MTATSEYYYDSRIALPPFAAIRPQVAARTANGGLRKRGYAVTRERIGAVESVYRISRPSNEPAVRRGAGVRGPASACRAALVAADRRLTDGPSLPRGFCIKRLTDLPLLWSEQMGRYRTPGAGSGSSRTPLIDQTAVVFGRAIFSKYAERRSSKPVPIRKPMASPNPRRSPQSECANGPRWSDVVTYGYKLILLFARVQNAAEARPTTLGRPLRLETSYRPPPRARQGSYSAGMAGLHSMASVDRVARRLEAATVERISQ